MDLRRTDFMKTLTQNELADLSDLEQLWDADWNKAYAASSDQEMHAIVSKDIPEQLEPRFTALLEKLKIHNSKLDLDKI